MPVTLATTFKNIPEGSTMEQQTVSSSYRSNQEDNQNEISEYYRMINITLLDEFNFKILSPFKINKSLSLMSKTWDWIKYSNNHKTITIKETNNTKFTEFMNLTKLEINGTFYHIKVNEYFDCNNTNKGVIYSKQLLEVPDDEILSNLESQDVCEIYRYKKLDSNNKWIETGSFALTFGHKKRPETILVGYMNLEVYPILQKPMQCTHCGLIGHTARKCHSSTETFCKYCHHNTYIGQIHNCIQICKNCKDSHFTDLRSCPAYKKETQILKIKTAANISYFEARKLFYLKSNMPAEILEKKTELVSTELKLPTDEHTSMNLLAEENSRLNKELKLTETKLEINRKLTEEILAQLKISTELNKKLSFNNEETQVQIKKSTEIAENYRKNCETAQYFSSCMKKFIDRNSKSSAEFQHYMKLFLDKDDSSDSFEYEE